MATKSKKLTGGVWRKVNGANVYISKGGKVLAGREAITSYAKDTGVTKTKTLSKPKEKPVEKPTPSSSQEFKVHDEASVPGFFSALGHHKDITPAERAGISSYTNRGYKSMNVDVASYGIGGMARQHQEELAKPVGKRNDSKVKRFEKIAALQAAALRHKLPENTTLYRGADLPKWQRDELQVGTEFTHRPFASTSVLRNKAQSVGADGFRSKSNNTNLVIRAKAGASGLGLRQMSKFKEEAEVLLPAGAKMKVVERREEKDGSLTVVVDYE